MTIIRGNGIEIDYAERGDGDALVLLRGLGTQRIRWPNALLEGLASRHLRVIDLDNRDAGLSQKFEGGASIEEAMAARLRGEGIPPPYTLSDMAQDVVGLLDALGVLRAHVVGISMGGMIAQRLAIGHGDRLLSMTSIMSTSGAPGLPDARPEAREALMSSPASSDRAAVVAHTVRTEKVFSSPGYPTPEKERRETAERSFDRCYCPKGVVRQMLAVVSDVDRADSLASIRVPCLVVHGEDDPLIPIECGRDTVERIPGAVFHSIPGMGHDIPAGLVSTLVELIADHVKRST